MKILVFGKPKRSLEPGSLPLLVQAKRVLLPTRRPGLDGQNASRDKCDSTCQIRHYWCKFMVIVYSYVFVYQTFSLTFQCTPDTRKLLSNPTETYDVNLFVVLLSIWSFFPADGTRIVEMASLSGRYAQKDSQKFIKIRSLTR